MLLLLYTTVKRWAISVKSIFVYERGEGEDKLLGQRNVREGGIILNGSLFSLPITPDF